MRLHGAVVPMATPTEGRSGRLDTDALERYTEFLVDGSVDGLFPGSSIGEFSSLTPDQNRRVVETVTDVVDDSIPVVAGCGDTCMDGVVESAEQARDAGADAAVVVTPYYLSTNQRGLEAFFRTVADRSPLPVLLYNIPALTGNRLSVETVESLADHENVVGLKDTSGDLTFHHDVITETPEEFLVFQGATELALASLDAGATGIIAGPANVFPAELTDLVAAHRESDYATAVKLMQEVVAPFVSATSDYPTAAAIKYVLSIETMDIGQPIPPLPTLSSDEQADLHQQYRAIADTIER